MAWEVSGIFWPLNLITLLRKQATSVEVSAHQSSASMASRSSKQCNVIALCFQYLSVDKYGCHHLITVGNWKRNFFFLQKGERGEFQKVPLCRNSETTERVSFCRKRLFLPKEGVSANYYSQFWKWIKAIWIEFPTERDYFCRKKAFLPKEAVSAETSKYKIKAERVSAEFLLKFSAKRPPKCSIGRPLIVAGSADDVIITCIVVYDFG